MISIKILTLTNLKFATFTYLAIGKVSPLGVKHKVQS